MEYGCFIELGIAELHCKNKTNMFEVYYVLDKGLKYLRSDLF